MGGRSRGWCEPAATASLDGGLIGTVTTELVINARVWERQRQKNSDDLFDYRRVRGRGVGDRQW
jgi:hypothetical protein